MGHPRWSTLNNVLWCASQHGETFGRELSLCCYCRRHLCLWLLSVFEFCLLFLQRLWYFLFLSSDFAGNEYNPVLLLLRKLFQKLLVAAAPTLSTPRFNFISQIFGSKMLLDVNFQNCNYFSDKGVCCVFPEVFWCHMVILIWISCN